MLASVVLVVASLLVLALLGLPARGSSSQAAPTTVRALLVRGAVTLWWLGERRDRRLGAPWAVARTAPRAGAGRPS